MSERVPVKVKSILPSKFDSNSYAIILSNISDDTYIPIIINADDVYPIAMLLNDSFYSRQSMHDTFINFTNSLNLHIVEVNINSYNKGVYGSDITIKNDEKSYIQSSRTSDAIAVALRVDAPIFITSDIINKVGVKPTSMDNYDTSSLDSIEESDINFLKAKLNSAIENENYEIAAQIQSEIKRRGLE